MDNGQYGLGGYPQGAAFGENFEKLGLDNERARMRVEEAHANLKPADENVDQNLMSAADVWRNSTGQNIATDGRNMQATGSMANSAVMMGGVENGLYGMPEAPRYGEIVDNPETVEQIAPVQQPMMQGVPEVAQAGPSVVNEVAPRAFNENVLKDDRNGEMSAKAVDEIDKQIKNRVNDPFDLYDTVARKDDGMRGTYQNNKRININYGENERKAA